MRKVQPLVGVQIPCTNNDVLYLGTSSPIIRLCYVGGLWEVTRKAQGLLVFLNTFSDNLEAIQITKNHESVSFADAIGANSRAIKTEAKHPLAEDVLRALDKLDFSSVEALASALRIEASDFAARRRLRKRLLALTQSHLIEFLRTNPVTYRAKMD